MASNEDLATINYDYDYPEGLVLKPGSELHTKLVSMVMEKARGSQEVWKRRFDGWNKIDRTLTAYIEKDNAEKKLERKDDRTPTTMVVPVSYATLDILLTYMVAAFLDEPILRYDGVGPEDVLGSMLMEVVVAQQCRKSKVPLELHTMWRDSFAYGVGFGYIGYEKQSAMRTMRKPETAYSAMTGGLEPTGGTVEYKESKIIYNGSTLTAVDPYVMLPDPETPIHRFQKGEFIGWVEQTNLMSLMSMEKENPTEYFNVRYLKHTTGTSKFYPRTEMAREDRWGGAQESSVTKPIDIVHMYIRLIPNDNALGKEEYPEKWLVSVAGDGVVIKAKKLGLDHDDFPFAVVAPDYDGHSTTPISRLETVYELQKTIDWELRSRVANVRKVMNNMLVVDPQMINIWDLSHPKPGGFIRTRRQAWGRGVKDAVMQLGVSDVTTGHVADIGFLTQIIRETTGSQDAISGIRRHTSERVSAAEAMQTAKGALSRLEKAARIASMQAHQDIAWQMASNTRQLMDEEVYAKIAGTWASTLAADLGVTLPTDRGRVKVSPKDIDIDFDVVPHDGSIPNSGDPQMWIQLYQTIAANPLLAQQLDMVRIFKFGAKLAGAKNLDDFVKKGGAPQVETMPDQQVLDQADQGNLVPVQ